MTLHEYLTYWFHTARESDQDDETVIDNLFGYLAAINYEIVPVLYGRD